MGNPNIEDWLVEFDIAPLGGQPDAAGMQAPGSAMGAGPGGFDTSAANMPGQGAENPDPNQQGQNPNPEGAEPPDVTADPQAPDMPEEKEESDFETWKMNYFKESIKGDPNELIDMIYQVRDRDLEPYQRKFVEDNLQIQFLRQYSDIQKASREIIKKIKEELNKVQPGVSLVNHIAMVLEANPNLYTNFIKLNGLWGAKGDVHRKFMASLLNAVQVGGAQMDNEDIVYEDNDFSIAISTRYNSNFGNTILGNWSLREDDPERYLQSPELKRLEEGSPEEKDVLRRRIVLESIASKYETRAFIVNLVNAEGTIYTLGLDMADMLKSSYKEGKLVVRTTESENSEAMIDDDGKILPYIDLTIKYVKPTGQQTAEGKPETEELEFIDRKNGQLFLVAPLQVLKDAATTLQGIVLKDAPYKGNPSELQDIQRCVPSVLEILTRRC